MNKRNAVTIILGVMVLTGFSGFQQIPISVQQAEAEPTKRIVGYFPYWESGDTNSIDYSKLTDIIYFHIWPNADGTLVTSAINQNDLNNIRDNAHASGVNVLIAVGGWGVSDGFPDMASDSTARANFVSNALDYVTSNNLDGIDIDWETTIDQTKIDNQDILLSDLAAAFNPAGKLVTVAANGEVAELKSSAGNSVDWVNVMAYDMNWGSAEHSTFNDSVNALQMYENEGIPKEKLSLGIPFYGRDNNTNAIKYEDIVASCNPSPEDNYCNGYFFNGIDLVQQKSQFVLDNGYDGVMIWNLGQDTYDETSLLEAINQVLNGEPLPDVPPVANADNYSTNAESVLNISSPGVLANDSDQNGDTLTAVLYSDVSNGVLTLNSDGSFSYSPNVGFVGIDSFNYHANDGANDSNVVGVTITVNPINYIHLENLEITKSGNKRWTGTVTITVFGENNNPVSGVTAIGDWSGGASGTSNCTTDSAGQCSVSKPTKGDSLTFTVNDLTGDNYSYDSSANDVDNSITINQDGPIPGQNSPPISDSGGPYSAFVNESISFDGSNSSDPDGDALTYLWDFGDGGSSTEQNPTYSYFSEGSYFASLQVTDVHGESDTSSTTVTVSSQGGTSLAISQISPDSMVKGQTITATIVGEGFEPTSIITFEGGKWVPTVISTTVIDGQTMEIEVTRSSGGPNKDFVYDVTVTNENGDSFTLTSSFTVTS